MSVNPDAMTRFIPPSIPIIQAPMAGGITTPELVAAVSNAGGAGSFGFAYSTPEAIAADLAAVKRQTSGVITANFFVFSEPPAFTAADAEAACAALEMLPLAPEDGYHVPQPPFYPDLAAQLAPVMVTPPSYLTFHFGIPPQGVMADAHARNIAVGITATCRAEAAQIAAAGADFIVAQGHEAGGHRGTFAASPDDDMHMSTLALTAALSDEVELPVVSAGGLMTTADIRAALQAGASAVQMGTAFLCADEAGTGSAYRQTLLARPARPTLFTRAFSGRNARAISTEFTSVMTGAAHLPFPVQNSLTAGLRGTATKAGNAEYQSLWAGTGYEQVRAAPAAEIIKDLAAKL